MCTPREDCCWPLLGTAVPYWNIAARTSAVSPTVVISIDEIERKRYEFAPKGQSSLHLACQRNSPLATVKVLVKPSLSVLEQVDDEGNTPLMIAIQHGGDVDTIEYIVRKDLKSLFQRNMFGTTALHMAVEYACSTVVSVRRGAGRIVRRGGHPRQLSHDENALRVLSIILWGGPHALEVEDCYGTAPLHSLVAHNGPGRSETLRVLIESIRNPSPEWRYVYNSNPATFSRVSRKLRLKDSMTPLHLACQAEHFCEDLVHQLLTEDPHSISTANCLGQTPLHLLCSINPSKEHIRRRLALQTQQEKLTRLIEEMSRACPHALRITDQNRKLALHLYLECPLFWPKRPEVVTTMLELYPESAWIPSPTLGSVASIITSHALLSSQSLDITLDYGRCDQERILEQPQEDVGAEHNEDFSIVDPNLLCLYVILNHWHMHGMDDPQKAKDAANDVITVLELFMSQNPISFLQQPVCGNSLKCVIRLVVSTLFQAQYRLPMLAQGLEYPRENLFMKEYIPEMTATLSLNESVVDFLSRRVEFLVRSDGSLVTMSVLLPSFESKLFFTMFPTWTPEWFAGSQNLCPVYLSFGFIKWCVDYDIPNVFNLPLAAEALGLPTREILIPNAARTIKFFSANGKSFDPMLVKNVGAFASAVLAGDGDEDDDNESSDPTAPSA